MQYSKNPENIHAISVKSLSKNNTNIGRRQREKDKLVPEINLINMPDKLIEEYIDRYEGVKSEILVTTRFDENSDLSMTYLVKTNRIRDRKRDFQCQNNDIQQVSY